MKIKAKETFEQKFSQPTQRSNFGNIDYLKFVKGQVYNFFVVPKVTHLDLAAEEVEIDYPFERVLAHFNVAKFMQEYRGAKGKFINCTGCDIDKWMSETRLPKTIFRIAVPTEFQLTYVIYNNDIKIAWFQDYLYDNYRQKIGKLMNDKGINLIDALRHKVRMYTNEEGKFDILIEDVQIPPDSKGLKTVFKAVYEKPLDQYIEQILTTDQQTIDSVLHALKDYSDQVIKSEKEKDFREKMEKKTAIHEAALEAGKPLDYEAGGNDAITDDEEQPF